MPSSFILKKTHAAGVLVEPSLLSVKSTSMAPLRNSWPATLAVWYLPGRAVVGYRAACRMISFSTTHLPVVSANLKEAKVSFTDAASVNLMSTAKLLKSIG